MQSAGRAKCYHIDVSLQQFGKTRVARHVQALGSGLQYPGIDVTDGRQLQLARVRVDCLEMTDRDTPASNDADANGPTDYCAATGLHKRDPLLDLEPLVI
jgi:hypothetical protein